MNLLKKILATSFAAVLALAMLVAPLPALAQTYPTATPTYVPNAVLPSTTLSATGYYYFNANGVAGASVRISALSGTLAATIQGSNDPYSIANGSATWSTLYYLDATAPTTAAANSITANGLYVFNTAGFTRFRVNVGTLSGDSHVVTIQASANVGPNVVYTITQPAPAGSATIGNVGNVSEYPVGATPITVSNTGTTAAVTAALAHASAKTTYICGFSITTSATSATVVAPTVTGVITATLTFSQYVPANTAGVSELRETFTKCIPASATDTAISVISGAASTGGVTAVNAWGYQL